MKNKLGFYKITRNNKVRVIEIVSEYIGDGITPVCVLNGCNENDCSLYNTTTISSLKSKYYKVRDYGKLVDGGLFNSIGGCVLRDAFDKSVISDLSLKKIKEEEIALMLLQTDHDKTEI